MIEASVVEFYGGPLDGRLEAIPPELMKYPGAKIFVPVANTDALPLVEGEEPGSLHLDMSFETYTYNPLGFAVYQRPGEKR